jgi:perosamine synthetase
MGLAQLKKFDSFLEKKNKIHKTYTDFFKNDKNVEIYQPPEKVSPFIPFRVILKTKNNEASSLMQYMRNNGAEPRMFFYPLHKQPAFEKWADDQRYHTNNFPVSSRSYDNGICLPSFVAITEEQIEYVCETIRSYYA